MKKLTLPILDMHCSNCAMKIESLEDELPGIRLINASYQKGQMVVEFDESQVSLETIVAAIKHKGYSVGG